MLPTRFRAKRRPDEAEGAEMVTEPSLDPPDDERPVVVGGNVSDGATGEAAEFSDMPMKRTDSYSSFSGNGSRFDVSFSGRESVTGSFEEDNELPGVGRPLSSRLMFEREGEYLAKRVTGGDRTSFGVAVSGGGLRACSQGIGALMWLKDLRQASRSG